MAKAELFGPEVVTSDESDEGALPISETRAEKVDRLRWGLAERNANDWRNFFDRVDLKRGTVGPAPTRKQRRRARQQPQVEF